MASDVLVPFDGSPQSERALEHAIGQFPEASITALHVIDPIETAHGGVSPPEESLPDPEDRAIEITDRAAELAAEHDREIETEVIVGEPARDIVEHAAEEEFDHIVIGSHGREGFSRVLLGSVAELVVRRSTAPVTVVR